MTKPREWKIYGMTCAEKGSDAFDNNRATSIHVIERSAYDALERQLNSAIEGMSEYAARSAYTERQLAEANAMIDKLAEALRKVWQEGVTAGALKDHVSEALAELAKWKEGRK